MNRLAARARTAILSTMSRIPTDLTGIKPGPIYSKQSTMGEQERAAIFRLAGAEDGSDLLQEEDLNDNCYPVLAILHI